MGYGHVHNVSGAYSTAGAFAWLDFVKGSTTPVASVEAYPGLVNANGFLQSTPTTTVQSGTRMPGDAIYSGRWRVKWTGTAGNGTSVSGIKISCDSQVGSPSGNYIANNANGLFLSGTDGEVTFQPPANNVSLSFYFLNSGSLAGVTTGGIDSLTSFTICREDQAALLDAGEIFNPDYIAFHEGLGAGILRFLDPFGINTSNRSSFTYDTPQSYLTYSGDSFHPDLWAGTVSYDSGADIYTVSAPPGWGGLVHGATVQVYIGSGNGSSSGDGSTTGARLNVGSTSNVRIINMGLNDSGLGTTGRTISASSIHTFVYDAEENFWIWRAGGLTASWPQGIAIALCNELGTDFWDQFPHMYPPSECAARAVAASQALDLNTQRYFCENSNEIGTPGYPGFTSVYYAQNKAILRGFPATYPRACADYAGLMIRRNFAAVAAAWPSDKLDRLFRVGTGLVYLTDTQYRWDGADLTLDASDNYTTTPGDIVTNYTASPNRPRDYCDALSMGNYYSEAHGGGLQSESLFLTRQTALNIAGIANENPVRVTTSTTPNGWSTGRRVNLSSGIGGMTELRSTWATITSVPGQPTQWTLSNIVSSTDGSSVSNDATGYGTYTSGGTISATTPGRNDALIEAIDDYDSGDPARMEDAINWMSSDLRSGMEKYGEGDPASEREWNGTLAWWVNPSAHSGLVNAPDLVTLAAGKPIIIYEGGYEKSWISELAFLKLGYAAGYGAKHVALREAFMNSRQFRNVTRDYFQSFMAYTGAIAPSQLSDMGTEGIGDHVGEATIWALAKNLYTTPYQSYYGIYDFNRRKRRYRVVRG